jgi:hypothetical protein
VALSGDPEDIRRTDRLALELFPDNAGLQRWIPAASQHIAFQGLPARICWLGYGERAKLGLAINNLVRHGELKAPVVIGRDHLDCGSVASPNRETEGMKDGSDAVADWAVLNALVNTAAGASWVSFHHGGGVGMGYSLHAGMVIVADGTDAADERLRCVLTTDPGMGIIRHADAGYSEAVDSAARHGVRVPMLDDARANEAETAPRRDAVDSVTRLSERESMLDDGRANEVGTAPRRDAMDSATRHSERDPIREYFQSLMPDARPEEAAPSEEAAGAGPQPSSIKLNEAVIHPTRQEETDEEG